MASVKLLWFHQPTSVPIGGGLEIYFLPWKTLCARNHWQVESYFDGQPAAQEKRWLRT